MTFFPQAGTSYCEAEDPWPKTPSGDTVIDRTCADGRVGYKSRTCEPNGKWQQVFDYCVNQKLNIISNDAQVSVVML